MASAGGVTKKKRPRRGGKKTPAALQSIVDWVAAGKTLTSWCEADPDRPCFQMVYQWRKDDEDFDRAFARAREVGYDVIADDTLRLVDTPPGRDALGRVDKGEVAWRRAQVDLRLKLLARWFPTRYGDRLAVDHGGGVQVEVVTGVPEAEE